MLIASLGLIQTGCDIREATIVYDVEFPRADSDQAQGGGGGSGSGGSGRLQLLSQLQPQTSQKTAEQLLLQEPFLVLLLLMP